MPEFETISVRGQSLRILRAGRGRPFLWLRGSDASDGWREYMSSLAQDYDVIVPEHPGFGNVAKPEWLDSAGDMAMFYLDMIDALKLDGVHLAGHGLGAWIAAEMAVRDPRRLASLTLVDAAGLLLSDATGEDPFLRSEEDAILDQFADAKLAKSELERRLTPETEDVRIANQMVIAQLAWSPRWHDPHLRKWLHRIGIPALVVWGDKDRLFPLAHARAWTKAIAGAKLEIISGCGHNPPIEKPQQFVAGLRQFLSNGGKAT